MVFKGTARRDGLDVNRDFDRIGAKHNAQTAEEDTIYHVTCLPEYLPGAFDVLADILRPKLDEADFETEKQVILEEIHMYNDNPAMVAFEAAKEEHFAPHPLGRSVLGTVDTITAMKIGQMRDYFDRRYSARNIVLAVAGKIGWEDVVALAEAKCGAWGGGEATRPLAPVRGHAGARTIVRKDDHQMTVVGVADGPPLESDDRYAASLLATILGDHTSSRLYWELIDPGHADGVDLSYQDFNQAGAFFTFLSCDPELAGENLERIGRVYREIAAEGPTEDELEQARNKVMARVVIRSERPMGRLMPLGYHWAYRREYMPIEKEMAAYAAVTVEDIKRVLAEYPLMPMTVVTAGPDGEDGAAD
jgi:predicted Zn-dependent peptidase